MAIYNIQRGRSKVVDLKGLKEMQTKIKTIQDRFAKEEAAKVCATAAEIVHTRMEDSAKAANVPHEVLEDLFTYSRQRWFGKGRQTAITALAGMRKRGRKTAKAYVTWHAGTQVGFREKTSRSKRTRRSLSIRGRMIGENLGTMWEIGTTKLRARSWGRKAIRESRNQVLTELQNGFRAILEKRS